MSGSLLASTGLSSSIFTEIPTNIEVPGTYVQVQPIYTDIGLLPYPARILLIAQMATSGTAIPNKIYNLVTPQQGTQLCGPGSIGEAQVRDVLATNPSIPVDMICVADAVGAAKAAGSIMIGGTWSQAGVLPLMIDGVRLLVPVGATDVSSTVAANAVALINAQVLPDLPVTAAVGGTGNTNSILLTAVNGGTESNNIGLSYANLSTDVLPQGMTVTITPMAGGTLNPSIAPVISAISGLLYSDIICPWQDPTNLGLLATELDNRFTATSHLDGYAWVCLTGSYGTMLSAKNALNSRFRSVIGVTNPQSAPWHWSACMGAVCAQSLFNDPSKQCKGLVLALTGPLRADLISPTEQQLLLPEGISTFNVLSDGTVVLSKVVSENTTDNTGTLTTAWHDVMAAKVATRIRYDWRSYASLTYPSDKLADDGSLAADNDPSVATPNRLKGSWAARCLVYGKQGWIEDVQNQVRLSNFARDQNDRNRVNSTQPYLRVGNLMILACMLQFEV
jgi:phage tail sheath gpL-like